MHKVMDAHRAIAGTQLGVTTSAGITGMAKLTVLHKQLTDALPTGGIQEIRVIIARLEPGDSTPYHSHRFPVTVYMLEGVFTLELDGRDPIPIGAGEVFVEPSGVRMTGRNLSSDSPAVMVLFYVSDPETPFADPV
ncbi:MULTISPECIES: cupin domain-containing protein [Neorhizobium]|jgi:quercetin dioxygenase-like cupin family protein|uniref:cupin domain-containing protein n=1 Tax=Neorhizobium sp. T6_25 TaxID=2093833 RepID=UPI000CFA4159|nr:MULTISPECIES: cupin domain-containing protein [Neorhizobium]